MRRLRIFSQGIKLEREREREREREIESTMKTVNLRIKKINVFLLFSSLCGLVK